MADNSIETKNNFSPREYDKLENDLNHLETQTEIFRRVSYWLTKFLNCSFVLFYADQGKSSRDRVKYYGEQVHSLHMIGTVVEERTKNDSSIEGLYIHPSGALSLAVDYTGFLHGYLFIGPKKDKSAYTVEEHKLLGPVDRIINHSLLSLDVAKNREQKNRLRYAFSKYMSPEVVDNIMINPNALHPGGDKQNLTVIFTDLEKFTELSENLEPNNLLRILNMYLNEMSQVILSLGGTIDKYEGDAIMAFFGAPKPQADHAVRCCLAALRMKKMEDVLNEQLIREKLVENPLFTRMGINTGDMIVGNVGSMQRMDYTVIGNNVNIAARIEPMNKKYKTSILISESTYLIVKDYFFCRNVGATLLKGVSEPVMLYELIEENKNTIPKYEMFSEVEEDDYQTLTPIDME